MAALRRNWSAYAVAILAIGAAVGGGAYWFARERGPELPDVFWFECANCGHEFQMTPEEFKGLKPTDSERPTVVCQRCDEREAVTARKCPACGEVFAAWDVKAGPQTQPSSVYQCPECGWSKLSHRD